MVDHWSMIRDYLVGQLTTPTSTSNATAASSCFDGVPIWLGKIGSKWVGEPDYIMLSFSALPRLSYVTLHPRCFHSHFSIPVPIAEFLNCQYSTWGTRVAAFSCFFLLAFGKNANLGNISQLTHFCKKYPGRFWNPLSGINCNIQKRQSLLNILYVATFSGSIICIEWIIYLAEAN